MFFLVAAWLIFMGLGVMAMANDATILSIGSFLGALVMAVLFLGHLKKK